MRPLLCEKPPLPSKCRLARWRAGTITMHPTALNTKLCAECGTEFQPFASNARTCSIRCKQRGERKRRAARNGAPAAQARLVNKGVQITDLIQCAKAQESLQDQYVVITGSVPEWPDMPATTEIIKQGDGSWIMRHKLQDEDELMAQVYNMTLEEFKKLKHGTGTSQSQVSVQ